MIKGFIITSKRGKLGSNERRETPNLVQQIFNQGSYAHNGICGRMYGK